MIVRSHLPWPLRWASAALTLGFSAALALWAFEVGKGIAGLERSPAGANVALLKERADRSQTEKELALAVANSAESLLKAERAAQDHLVQRLKSLEMENLALKADLGFYERLLPASGEDSVSIRGLRADPQSPGQLRFQLLMMQAGRNSAPFNGRLEIMLTGTTASGEPWSFPAPAAARSFQLKQHLRVDGWVDHPEGAVVKAMQVRVLSAAGAVKATQTVRL